MTTTPTGHDGEPPLLALASLADLTDVDFFLHGLDPTLFPGIPPSIQVHHGFAQEHAK